jgi:TRAP-type C4-dicarboxylate transport system permease small subunit
MSVLKIVAIVLILAGIAGLVYGKFTYTKATHEAKLGPLDLSVKEKKTVNIPLWAGIAAIVAGGLLLVVPRSASAG